MISILHVQLLAIALLSSISCALPGNFLVLRGTSLISDAIGHSILLGIVLGFLLTGSVHSPFIFVCATLVGLMTALLTELLINTKKIFSDAAIGLIFPLLFSIAILCISLYAHDIHLDADAALLGELAFTPFNRLIIDNIDFGPISLWTMSIIVLTNILCLYLWYPKLKITSFDPDYAYTLGYRPQLIHYGLMTLTSLTIVGAFETAGAILVVALMIIPAATAYLITKRLSHMIITSTLLASITTIAGCILAHLYNVSIAGSIATCNGALFLIILFYKTYYLK